MGIREICVKIRESGIRALQNVKNPGKGAKLVAQAFVEHKNVKTHYF